MRALERRLSSSVQDTELLVFIEKAQAFIDAKLGEVFVTPFYPVPDLIKHLATDLALYFYLENQYSSQRPNVDETLEVRYKRIMDTLGDIITGTLSLGPAYPSKNNGGMLSTNDEAPIFDYENPVW